MAKAENQEEDEGNEPWLASLASGGWILDDLGSLALRRNMSMLILQMEALKVTYIVQY